MRILLADDQVAVRSALQLLLEQEPDCQVVGETTDTTELLLAVTTNVATNATTSEIEKAPDLVLLDWELPGLPADQLVRLLRYERPFLKIIAMSSRPEAYQAAMDAGVEAFVSKSEPPEQVLAHIKNIL